MLLTGTFERAVDEKQRFALPKSLREAVDSSSGIFYMTPGTDGSVAIYDESSFSALANRLSDAPPTAGDVRAFGRLFYAQASRVELDKQGRLRIPQELAQWAHLENEIVLAGVGDHLELWNPQQWKSYVQEKQPHYDQLAESAFQGSIRPK